MNRLNALIIIAVRAIFRIIAKESKSESFIQIITVKKESRIIKNPGSTASITIAIIQTLTYTVYAVIVELEVKRSDTHIIRRKKMAR